ncbi:MAG TPA: Ca2+-dependent phosphoinositide-specific phospholipase C [Acidimicrobiia bacterium]|nr:Ca2+-dependent phosphoinositide-specific phospholipase C [Acidimicrobiia bacterium]
MRRGERAVFVSIAVAVVVVAAVSGGAPSAGANRLDNTLRTNQVQVLATHNSYHIQQDVPIQSSPTTQYTHAPLDQQLDLGVRGFELDVVNPPDGQFPVLHTPVVDNTSNCTPIAQCLDVTRTWSKAHPGHVPIFILIEPKDDDIDFVIDPTLRRFDAAGLDQLDAIVRKSLGRQLITPDSVRGKAKTLRGAVTGRGWPSLGKTRGKIMVILNTGGPVRDAYRQGHPSLEGRAMFVTSGEQAPSAAVIKLDTPDEPRIQQLVKDGFIVRTRADADLIEARANDVTRRDLALRSGAQIVSTDFEVAVPAIGGDYVVQIPGGTPARCDPVNAPKNCRPSDVENPRRLTRKR